MCLECFKTTRTTTTTATNEILKQKQNNNWIQHPIKSYYKYQRKIFKKMNKSKMNKNRFNYNEKYIEWHKCESIKYIKQISINNHLCEYFDENSSSLLTSIRSIKAVRALNLRPTLI